jgi:choline dehydrogenase
MTAQIFDFVVIGAGSAGCAVAGRLSESGKYTVCLIEAGPPNRSIWVRMPIGYGKTFYDPRHNWMYQTEPVPGFGGRVSYWPRGKVLGGSSSINAMVYSRGQASDFNRWAQMGNAGWSWHDVLETYRRLEDHDLGSSLWHGAGGPLHVTTIDTQAHPLARLFIEAACNAGLPRSHDLNGATIEGVGTYQITTRNGFRESSATAYLRKRPNLAIITASAATRLEFDGRRATGVRIDRAGTRKLVEARREVILSGGSIGSPQLLQLSGIGPAEVLARHGIQTRLDLPAVGRNLSDHLCYDHVYRSRLPSLNDVLRPWSGKVSAALAYLFKRSGPLSLSLNQAGGYYRSSPDKAIPDIQLYFSPLTYERAPPRKRPLMSPDAFPGFSTSVSPCKPKSLGYLEIRSADWHDPPLIQPNYFDHPNDIAEMLSGARFLRRLAGTEPLRSAIDAELKPGSTTDTDAALIEDIRARSYSVFHPVGTCAMGTDPFKAVVDPQLRVHGINGLRVIDASIFPEITSGNTNAPAIMVGEHGASFVLAAV